MLPARGPAGARDVLGRDAGQATAELALLLPLLLLLVLALFQGALVARDQVLVVHAARDAAREASVDAGADRVHEAVDRLLPGADVEVEGGGDVGRPISVTVRYEARTTLPVIGPLFPDPTLTARAVMRAER